MKKLLRIAITLVFCAVMGLCLGNAAWAENGDYILPANTTVIEDEAFSGCAWMKTVTIPAGVKNIGNGAFESCTGLTDVYFGGTQAQWATVEIGSGNERLTGASIHCIVDSGTCGENLTWMLYSNGTMTIYGTGDMYDYEEGRGNLEWRAYDDQIRTIVICDGVSSIGAYAFADFTLVDGRISGYPLVMAIEIPTSVTRIGDGAFDNCTSLKNVAIPKGITSIGDGTFINCISMTSVTIPEGVTSIGNGAFYGCKNLTEIVIPEGVTQIGNTTFRDCTGLKSITIPGSVTSIGDYAFYGCTVLNDVMIPYGVTSIGYAAFCNCTGLKSIVIPASVSSFGDYVFYECNQLASVTIPEGTTSIGYAAFFDCANLTTVVIPNGVTSIEEYAFRKCSGLASVVIPSSVTTVGKSAFSGCTSLNDVYYTGTSNEWNAIVKGDNNEPLSNAELHFSITLNSIGLNQHILGRPEHLQFQSDIPLFNADIFVDDENWMRDTQFSLSSDGTILTLDCLALDSLAAGAHFVKISVNSLNASTSFEILNPVITAPEITVQPQSQIFDASFKGFPSFTVEAIGGDLTYTWEYRYDNTEDWVTLFEVNPPYGITQQVPNLVFNRTHWIARTSQQRSELTFRAEISHDGLQFRCKVSNSAGVTYSNIATLTVKCVKIHSHITQGGKAYYSTGTDHSEKLLLDRYYQYADVGDTVYVRAVPDAGYKTDIRVVSTTDGTEIPPYDYPVTIIVSTENDGQTVNETEIPANGAPISSNALPENDDLSSGNTNNLLTALSDGTVSFVMPAADVDLYVSFRMAAIIASGTWGDLTWTLDEDGLLRISGNGEMLPFNYDDMTSAWHSYSSDIHSVVLGSGVTSIGTFAFNNCSNIESIAFSKDVASIGWWALDGCSSLLNFEVDEANLVYCDLDGVLFSKSLDTIVRYPSARSGSYVIPEGVSVIGGSAFYECKNLTGITIPESVTEIGSNAFSGCIILRTVILPQGLTTLGSEAFYGCSSLSYVRIYETTTVFGDQAFIGCTCLKTAGPIGGNYNYEFGWMNAIPDFAFWGCSSLTNIVLPDSIEVFGDYAFYGCSGLTYIPLPSNLQSIGRGALSECSGIKDLSLPLGVIEIGEWAFSYCTSLESAFIPSRVKTLSNRLFSNCSSLSKVSLSYGLESIGEYVFAECSNLLEISIPSTVTSIGEYAFYNCGLLSSITVPEYTTEFGNNTFTGCTNLKTAGPIGGNYDYSFGWKDTIPANAFRNCVGLVEVAIPDSVTTISEEAFYGCSGLIVVVFPKRLANINDSAFRSCRNLTSVTIPGGVDCIGTSAFKYCSGLTTVTIEEGVTGIGEDAFSECRNLTSVAIPSSMQSVGKNAFYNCNSLNAVYYSGSEQQWNTLQANLGASNTPLLSAKKHYYSTGGEIHDFVDSGVLISGVGWSVKWDVLYNKFGNTINNAVLDIYIEGYNSSIGTIPMYSNLEDNTVMPWLASFQKTDFGKICVQGSATNPLEIISEQFCGYDNVRTVQLTSVSSLQAGAFSECVNLETVKYDGFLTHIGEGAFRNDTSLSVFKNNSQFSNLEMIGDEAFMNTGLPSFESNNTLRSIGVRAFQGVQLAKAVIGNDVVIGENAFTNHNGFVIICYRNSEAHQYAQREGIECLLMDMDIPISFYGYNARFSNSYFSDANPSTASNRDLALLSGVLSWAVYNDAERPSMRSVFSSLGIQSDDMYESSTNNYRYAIAKRKIFVDGEIANLLIVVARGTKTDNEKLDDIFTQANSYFFGYNAYDIVFDFEKDKIMAGVNSFVANHPEIEQMPLKVLITGHSLGGAAANLLGARFTKFSEDGSWWAPLLSKDDIYVYTFASIDSIQSDHVIDDGYENIHNIYNYHDTYGPHGWTAPTAAGHSGHGKFGHIDLFYLDVDHGALYSYGDHMMDVYLDAVVNNKVKYEHPFAEALLNDELVA